MHQVYTSLTDDATLHLPPEKLLFSSRRRFCGNLVKTRSMINWDNDGDIYIYTGWWYTYPFEKYEFVKWDCSSQLNGKIKFMFQTTNQLW